MKGCRSYANPSRNVRPYFWKFFLQYKQILHLSLFMPNKMYICNLHASLQVCKWTAPSGWGKKTTKNSSCFFLFLSILLSTLPLTLQGGSITARNKHPVFWQPGPGSECLLVLGFLSELQGDGTRQNEKC